jgi:hypothetical protein
VGLHPAGQSQKLRDEVNQVVWYSSHRDDPAPPPPPARNAATPLVFPDEQEAETVPSDKPANGRGGDLPPAPGGPPSRSLANRR